MRRPQVGQGRGAGVQVGDGSAWRAAAAGAQIVAALSLVIAGWLYFQYHQRSMTRTGEILVIAGGYILVIFAHNIYCALGTLMTAVTAGRPRRSGANAFMDRLNTSSTLAFLHVTLALGLIGWFLEMTAFDYFQPVATLEDVALFLGL